VDIRHSPNRVCVCRFCGSKHPPYNETAPLMSTSHEVSVLFKLPTPLGLHKTSPVTYTGFKLCFRAGHELFVKFCFFKSSRIASPTAELL
jgi:hypothetical protein